MSSPVYNLANSRRTPLPNFKSSARWTAEHGEIKLTAYQIKEYLARYPTILDEFLLESSSVEYLEAMIEKLRKRRRQSAGICTTPSRRPTPKISTLYSEIGIEELCRRIMQSTTDGQIYEKIYDISKIIANAVDADDVNVYVMESTEADLSVFCPGAKKRLQHVGPVGYRMTVSAHVSVEKRAVNARDIQQDSRFPKGVRLGDDAVHHVMCLPVLLECGSVYAVIEFTRGWKADPFSAGDFELTTAIMSWITACVQKMKLNKLLTIQTKMNSYLLECTKVMFDDMDNIDGLVTNIMQFTKELVSADRCALFLVDEDRKELFADYFDEGRTSDEGIPLFTKKSQIRFPDNKGIAGYVAKTGEAVNIKDAYSDDRFNREIDKKTGYHTKHILCMPIVSKTGVLGVVQMINRLNGDHFTQEDESSFKLFAVYCALALHYARIYHMLTHQQAKYKVAMEVLQFHLACKEDNLLEMIENPELPEDKVPEGFDRYDFCCYDYDELLPKMFIKMLSDMFGKNTFEFEKLCRFTLTVRKNYRPITYHNWQHGFHVSHCLWVMLTNVNKYSFSRLEKMAFLIGGICHDLDHRGYNNDFFKKLKLPLAALYSTSTMEQHHYKQTITILHSEGHDILSFLTSVQHRMVLENIKAHILATDLALYFPNQKFLAKLIESESFDFQLPEHKEALTSLMMTAADLCAIPKPWGTQKRTVEMLYEEFYMQGDEEKKRGMTPIPMMDRVNKDDIPKQQVGFVNFICLPLYNKCTVEDVTFVRWCIGFLSTLTHLPDGKLLDHSNLKGVADGIIKLVGFVNFICLPLYNTLATLLPETSDLLEGCKACKESWETYARENDTKRTTLHVE